MHTVGHKFCQERLASRLLIIHAHLAHLESETESKLSIIDTDMTDNLIIIKQLCVGWHKSQWLPLLGYWWHQLSLNINSKIFAISVETKIHCNKLGKPKKKANKTLPKFHSA